VEYVDSQGYSSVMVSGCVECSMGVQCNVHRLEDFLPTINSDEIRKEVESKIRSLAEKYNCDINCICPDCFMEYKAQSVMARR